MQPITVTVKNACEMTGLKRTTIYRLIGENKIASTTVGRRRLVKLDSIRELLGEAA